MTTAFQAYMDHGLLSGTVMTSGPLSELLELVDSLVVDEPVIRSLAGGPDVPIERSLVHIDELFLIVAPPATRAPADASWHPILLECGPYQVAAVLPTKAGFDPERSAIRPGGTFVLLGQVVVSVTGSGATGQAEVPLAWVNRYVVESYEAELDLGAFFPGARRSRPAISGRRPQ
jgi:hypothetical protein